MVYQAQVLRDRFENELLPELEISLIPYKLKARYRVELMNTDFVEFAKRKGVIDSDIIDDISWRRVTQIVSGLSRIAEEFYTGISIEEIHEPETL